MTKTSISVQDLRRRIALKAKADSNHRFWGMYSHIWKENVLAEAFRLAKLNGGAAGVDGVSFKHIEKQGKERFLEELSRELRNEEYRPLPPRVVQIPKPDGTQRTLKIPAIRDRIVQGALKLIMEPIYEMDFQPGSFGYRPRRSAHDAIRHVRLGLGKSLQKVLDLDLSKFFDRVRHDLMLSKLSKRVDDDKLLRLCKVILKSGGRRGLPQGSLIGPLWANVFLNELDQMLEKACQVTKRGRYEAIRYARFADDLVVLVSSSSWSESHKWFQKVEHRVREIIASLDLEVNEKKTNRVDFSKGEPFDFLGFQFQGFRKPDKNQKIVVRPQREKRTEFLRSIKRDLKRNRFKPVEEVVAMINPRIRGWCNYFSWGNARYDIRFVAWQIEIKVRKFASRQQKTKRGGTRWSVWSTDHIYDNWGLYRARFVGSLQNVRPRPAT